MTGWVAGTVDNVDLAASLPRALAGESPLIRHCALADCEIKKQLKMIIVITNVLAEYRIAPSLGISTL